MEKTRPPIDATTEQDLTGMLRRLYGERAAEALGLIKDVAAQHATALESQRSQRWTERDVALITYGDQVQSGDRPTLEVLREFLVSEGLHDLFSVVHLLPIFPYSSDDGFSVIDYRKLQPQLGGWSDVQALGEHVDLAMDLVLNHCSRHSDWFERYLAGEEPYTRYFVEADPDEDLSAVTRPRNTPLLTPFETSRGTRHLWTTFSDDQIDLNFAEPAVLAEMIDILLLYIRMGARVIRLDAIAFLWKQPGTTSLHLTETHLVVKLLRRLADAIAPGVTLLAEVNVPHSENVRYLGDGDEAHMIYQFSVPPLLVDAFAQRDATALSGWLSRLEPAPGDAAYFNFTASHDGIGVRPLEELVPEERVTALVDHVRALGGRVSVRRLPDGSDKPYELNIAYADAVGDPDCSDVEREGRFLSSQAFMLALRGLPAVYFHSLVGTRNHQEGVEETGRARSINRRKYDLDELRDTIGDDDASQQRVYRAYRRMLGLRRQQPAFHPDGPQVALETGDSAVAAFERRSPDGRQHVVCVANFGVEEFRADVEAWTGRRAGRDLLSDQNASALDGNAVVVPALRVAWIELG